MDSLPTHSEFVAAIKGGARFHVHKGKAQDLLRSRLAEKRHRWAHNFWAAIWMLSIASAFGFLLFGHWWVTLVLLIVSSVLYKSIVRSATEFVLEQATQDQKFYEVCLKIKAIVPAD